MKKIIPLLAVLFLSTSVSAQYKKASFFGKEGRTYEIGSQLYAMGGDKGNPIGFKVAFGRDQDGKRFFSSWELQFIPSFKYSYVTTDDGDAAVTVNGTTKPYFLYALNYGFHVLKNDEEKRIVKPFVAAGLNIVLGGQSKAETFTPDNVYGLKKMTVQPAFSMGLSCAGVEIFLVVFGHMA